MEIPCIILYWMMNFTSLARRYKPKNANFFSYQIPCCFNAQRTLICEAAHFSLDNLAFTWSFQLFPYQIACGSFSHWCCCLRISHWAYDLCMVDRAPTTVDGLCVCICRCRRPRGKCLIQDMCLILIPSMWTSNCTGSPLATTQCPCQLNRTHCLTIQTLTPTLFPLNI